MPHGTEERLVVFALVTALTVVAAMPLGAGQSSSRPEIVSVDAPSSVTITAGGDRIVPITVNLGGVGAGIMGVKVELRTATASHLTVQLSAGKDPLVWSGNLTIAYTFPSGPYTLRATAQDIGRGTGTTDIPFVVEALAAAGIVETTISFDEVGPNAWTGPAHLTYRNLGNVPLQVGLSSTAFRHEDGAASIGADSLEVRIDGVPVGRVPVGASLPLGAMATGQGGVLELWFYVPSGSMTYVPAGNYTGTIALDVEVLT